MMLKSKPPINEPMQYDKDKLKLAPLWVLWFNYVAEALQNLVYEVFDYLQLNISLTSYPASVGALYWNAVDGTADINLYNGSVLQVGQELHFYGKASGNISNGSLCMFNGAQGDHIKIKTIEVADIPTIQENPHYIVGIATQNILNGEFGYCTWFGKVNNVFTTGYTVGDILYFSNTTGQLTNVQPSAPDRTIIIAAVIKLATGTAENGVILVRPSYNDKLSDLDDVNGTTLDTTGQLLLWDNTNGYWDASDKVYLNEEGTSGPEIGTNQDGTARDLHIVTGTDKTLVLDETVWVDIDFPIIARAASANNPTPATLIGNLTAPRWAVNDFLMCEGQEMVHLWKEGSTCYWHIHLITNGTEATNKYVKMEIEYTWATLNGQLQSPVTTSSDDLLIPANTPDRTHLIYPIASFTPSTAKIGTQVYARLKRVAATGTAPAADPFIPMLQIHIEVDTLGSRQLGTK